VDGGGFFVVEGRVIHESKGGKRENMFISVVEPGKKTK
jgi:hypothetical protein